MSAAGHCTVTRSYLDQCLREGADGLRAVAGDLPLPPHFSAAFPGRALARPLFAPRREMRRVAGLLTGFYDLLTSLPDRMFDGDVAAYCAALGITERKARILRRIHEPRPALYGRADLHRTGASWKLLEFNIGSELGGMERGGGIPRALLEVPRFRQFAQEHGLGHVDPGDSVARMLRKAAEGVSCGDDPVIVLLESDGRLSQYLRYIRPFQEYMRARGVNLRLAELAQLRTRDGKIHLDGVPVDVVLRYVTLDQICEHPAGEELMEPVIQAHENGRTAMVTPLSSCLYESKGTLAMLCAPRLRASLTEPETALLDELLPWTRSTAEPLIDVDGEQVDLVDHCRAHRADLILKPTDELRGNGIVAGWEVTDREWERALRDSTGRNFVIQRKVPPQPEPVCEPLTGTVEDWLTTWGVYVTDEGYAGTYIRALPAGGDSMVVSWDAKPQLTGVFEYSGTD